MFKPTLIAGAMLVAAACEPAPTPQEEQTPPEPQSVEAPPAPPADFDPFSFAIETGRWNAMIDRAREGVRLAPFPDGDEDLILRSDHSLKSGVLDLLRLQREACAKGLVTGADCDQIEIPGWAFEPPSADADIGELIQRSEWLGSALQALHGVGCTAGEQATGDERYCAVE